MAKNAMQLKFVLTVYWPMCRRGIMLMVWISYNLAQDVRSSQPRLSKEYLTNSDASMLHILLSQIVVVTRSQES